jgi:hypothetical protein
VNDGKGIHFFSLRAPSHHRHNTQQKLRLWDNGQ